MASAQTTLAAAKQFGAIGGLLTSLFGRGQAKVDDTRVIEQGQLLVNNIWTSLTGESLQLFGPTRYPDVPAGPSGNPAVNVDEAISAAQGVVAEARGLLTLSRSATNTFFTNGASGRIGLMQRVKAAREKAATSQPNFGGLSLSGITSGFKGASPTLIGFGILAGVAVLFMSRR